MKFFDELTNKKLGKTRFHFRIYEDELRNLYALLTKVKAYTPKTLETMHYHGMIKNMHKVMGDCLAKKKNNKGEIGSNEVRKIYNSLALEQSDDRNS